MNYLAHHYLARSRFPDKDPQFYVGNLLPDLLALYGIAKLRPMHLPVEAEKASSLLQGIRLHFETDVWFHGSAAFKQACTEASQVLKSAEFPVPIRRVFFLAHILVEIALDGYLLTQSPRLADDLYALLTEVAAQPYGAELVALSLDSSPPMTETLLSDTLERFVAQGWLRSYATVEGQAETLYRICRRADLSVLPDDTRSQSTLISVLTEFAPRIASFAPELLGETVGSFTA